MNPEVAAVYDSYPPEFRTRLLSLRELVLKTAALIEGVGEIEETLKWGEPSYLTPHSKSGSTIRLAWKESRPEQYSMFFKCTANVVPAFRKKFPDLFRYGGDRSIDFALGERVPVRELQLCIALALTYHRTKNLASSDRWKMMLEITGQKG